MGNTLKRTKSADEALQSLMRLCARGERSSGDALRLMRRWGVSDADAAKVLSRLKRERFIDDRRYTEFYVREKINLSGWGAYKIKMSLRRKGISPQIISEVADEMFGATDMRERLMGLLQRKALTIKAKNDYDAKTKLIRFGASRGFDMDMVVDCATQIIKCTDDEVTL